MSMSKKDLIDQIRILEHNWGVAEEGGDNVSKLLEEISENVPGVKRYMVDRVLGEGEYERIIKEKV